MTPFPKRAVHDASLSKATTRRAFIEKRSHALAMVLLTQREDLLIEEVKDDIGLDYVARFRAKGKMGLREFGVAVRGVSKALTKADADAALQSAGQYLKRYGPFLQPVSMFLFSMQDDIAWSSWATEPSESENGDPVLRLCDKVDCRKLDKKELNRIIERVDSWYDAVFSSLVVNGPVSRNGGRP